MLRFFFDAYVPNNPEQAIFDQVVIIISSAYPSLQNMNAAGFRVCVKELYGTRYDPVSVSYAVLAGQLMRDEKVLDFMT